MEQEPLFFEDIYDAYRHTVQRLGGAKKVGSLLWPDKSPDKAGEHLLNCLNRDRAEKLDPEQLLWIKREARKAGCHVVTAYENGEAGYAPPQPIEPEDEKAELKRRFIRAKDELKSMLKRFDELAE